MRIINQLFSKPAHSSRTIARQRLQAALKKDHARLSPAVMNSMRRDIIEAASKYVDLNPDGINLTYASTTTHNTLVADIPIFGARRAVH
ncbi:MAG: cell division topological specificity factor MinE [Anaerolineae bacterium]